MGKFGKNSPEAELFDRYAKMLRWSVELKEIAEPKGLPTGVLAEKEGEMLLAAVPKGARIIALDERGKMFSSEDLAKQIALWRDGGDASLAFVLGGADGLSDEVRNKAHLLLSLGKMVWPHLLARVMLSEQIYRAKTIMEGHPYHRA